MTADIRVLHALQDRSSWYRHGPDVSWLLFQGRRDLRPAGDLVRTTPDDHGVPSRDNAAGSPGVQDAVGLGGAEVEAGTGAGTEVEGGAR